MPLSVIMEDKILVSVLSLLNDIMSSSNDTMRGNACGKPWAISITFESKIFPVMKHISLMFKLLRSSEMEIPHPIVPFRVL